jgi:hypothetical protein
MIDLEKVQAAANHTCYEIMGKDLYKQIIDQTIRINDLVERGLVYFNAPNNGPLVKLSPARWSEGNLTPRDILLDTGARAEIRQQIAKTEEPVLAEARGR